MSNLKEMIDGIREETLTKHYDAALAELKDKTSEEPLKTVFNIYSGCVSKEIANEIAHRFNIGGVKAEVCISGIMTTKYYLEVTVALPQQLVHEEVKSEEVKSEEVKSEEVKPEETKSEGTKSEETKSEEIRN